MTPSFLQVDRLEDELVNEQDKFKAITEVDQLPLYQSYDLYLRSWTPPLPRCPATKPRCLATCCPPTRSNFFATELNDTWLPPCCAPQFSINSSKSYLSVVEYQFQSLQICVYLS